MFIEFIKRLYPWHFHLAGAMIILAVGVVLYFLIIGVRKFSNTVDSIVQRDKESSEARDKIRELENKCKQSEDKEKYLSQVVFGFSSLVDNLNLLGKIQDPEERMIESVSLMRRTIYALASDIKFHSGDHHRCCLWMLDQDNKTLIPLFYSAGFPNDYAFSRVLDKDRSIAGRALRTARTQNVPDVCEDLDWTKNDDSRSNYKSLIAIPIQTSVLTIDGSEPMSEDSRHIAELYSKIIAGTLDSYSSVRIAQDAENKAPVTT